MRRLISFLIAVFLLVVLCSCEISYQAPATGKMHILVYGNDYSYGNKIYIEPGVQFETNKNLLLQKTVNDAVQVGKAFTKLAIKAGIENYEAIYLIGDENREIGYEHSIVKNDVTLETLKSTIMSIVADSSENDITIIYYSGHGHGSGTKVSYGSDTSSQSYLIPKLEGNSSIFYKVSDLLNLVNKIKGVKVVIGDFCYSGSLVQSNNFTVTSGEYLQMDTTYLFAEKRNDIHENPSLFCLSASRYNELAREDKPLHGNFTNALLEALGWDEENQCLKTAAAEKNNRILLSEIAKYVIAHDEESKQTPMVSGGSNDIVLFSF